MKRQALPFLVAATLCGACDQSEPATTPDDLAPQLEHGEEEVASTTRLDGPAENEDLELKRARDVEIAMSAGIAKQLAVRSPKDNEAPSPQKPLIVPGKPQEVSEVTFGSPKGGDESGIDSLLAKVDQKQFNVSGKKQDFGGLGLHGAGRGGGGISSRGVNLGSAGRGTGSGYGKGVGVRSLGNLQGNRGAAAARVRRAEPVGTESYKDYGTNKFTDPTEDRFSTFSIDVDTGSYTIARRKLNNGVTPPEASVRVEEFVNYFGYNYPKPHKGAFGVSMEAAPSPFATDGKTHLLRVGVQGKAIKSKDRKPVHLTFLVDVSGSMQRPDKIGLVKKSLRILTDNLKEGDTVSMATYAGRTEVLLQPTRAKGKIIDAINQLSAGGSTAMASGLDLAYGLAEKNLKRNHENRVIVLSDGDANVGRTGWKAMLDQISGQVKKGVTLSTIGFGMGNYKDTTMEQLANKGNGNYFYVDSEKEAFKIFGDQLDGTLQVIAKDVKIQVDFNPDAVRRYRLIGYENRDIADKDFRNDKVDAGEIGAGHTVTALYEVQLQDELPERIATVRVRHKEPHGSDKAAEQSFGFDRGDIRGSIAQSSKDFQFAAAVAAFAEKLRKSPYAKDLTYDWILEVARAATAGRSDRKEFVTLVKKARRV